MLVIDQDHCIELLRLLAQEEEMVVDYETTGVNPHLGDRIIGAAIRSKLTGTNYFPFRHAEGPNLPINLLNRFVPVLSNPKVTYIGHNYKFDMGAALYDNIPLPVLTEDTMLAAHLMNECEYKRSEAGKVMMRTGEAPFTDYTLETLAKKYLGRADEKVAMTKILEERFPKVAKDERKGLLWKLSSSIVGKYAEGDVDATWELREFYVPHLKTWSLYKMWQEVNAYSIIITRMWARGLKLDISLVQQYMKEAESMIKPAKDRVDELVGYPINLNSWPQVQTALGVSGPGSADKEALEKMVEIGGKNKAIAEAILEFRGWNKVNSTYYIPYMQLKDSEDVIHPNLSLTGTVTGRLSSWKPNMQAVPRETDRYKVKDVFVAREGYTLIEADYSQAEIRLFTHYSKDVEMKRIIESGINMHTDVSESLKISRDDAKRLNFSVQYGIGPATLAENLNISIGAAGKMLEDYHRKFPGFRRLYQSAMRMAEVNGYIRMFTGRVKRYDQFNPSHKASSNLIQGGVAEIVRLAILKLDAELREPFGVHQLLTVHDSILFEAPDAVVMDVMPKIKAIMEDFDFDPKCKVDIKFGKSWGKMEKWPIKEIVSGKA